MNNKKTNNAFFLLVIIYAAFISLGLPDALLGASWPSMQKSFSVPFAYAGILQALISGCTIISSFFAGKMLNRFGCGRVTAVSVVMTAVALFGFAFFKSFYFLLFAALPLGLGAGAIDSGLNAFVAEKYESRHMSWLHSFWGIGALSGPLILSSLLAGGNSWRQGYLFIALIQSALSIVLFASLPLWQKVVGVDKHQKIDRSFDDDEEQQHISFLYRDVIKTPGVIFAVISFLLYCAAESSTGLWASSFFVHTKGFEPSQAAALGSLFYVGITFGRIATGFLTQRVKNINLIRGGIFLMMCGFLCMFLPLTRVLSVIGLVVAGLGCAPVFPCMIHETPVRFGKAMSPTVVGMQMAFAYTGVTLFPPLFGFLSKIVDLSVLPLFLLVYSVLLFFCTERLRKFSQ